MIAFTSLTQLLLSLDNPIIPFDMEFKHVNVKEKKQKVKMLLQVPFLVLAMWQKVCRHVGTTKESLVHRFLFKLFQPFYDSLFILAELLTKGRKGFSFPLL